MARKTQTSAVLEWLQAGESITSMQAFEMFGATRLSAIVFNLRKRSYDICAENVQVKNRFGQTVSIAKYTLES